MLPLVLDVAREVMLDVALAVMLDVVWASNITIDNILTCWMFLPVTSYAKSIRSAV